MNYSKIVPSLWFHSTDGKLSSVIDYYQTVFGEQFNIRFVTPLGETPSGNAEMGEVTLFGQTFSMMTTSMEHHPFNDAMALTINCEDQAEIDHYWNYFTAKGKEVQCGWCIDQHGLRWQVIPKNLGELMGKPNAWQVMMRQKKIIISEYFS